MSEEKPSRSDVAARVAAVVRPEVRALKAYPVAKAEGMIKLDAMENPYRLPAPLRSRMAAALGAVAINRYPDGAADAPREALRRELDLPPTLDVLLGNGSDELIQIIALALAQPGAIMLTPEPSFVMYRLSALHAGMRFVGVPLRPEFNLDVEAMLAAIARERPALIFLAYPNNPTGNLFGAAEMEAVVHAAPGLVVVDEAYYAFADGSFLSRLEDFSNVLVLRTLSKVGMAGLRLGYVIGAPEWLVELNKVRAPYNVNALTQAAVTALLSESGWVSEQAALIRAERMRLQVSLARLPNVSVYPTQTNFVVVRVADARSLFEGLKARHILVKNLDGWHTLLTNCLRITIGTPEENDLLLAACAELCRPL